MNSVVEVAVKALATGVNVRTGIAHPSDRSMAIHVFVLLREAGYDWEPDEVRTWLVVKGKWDTRHADDVKEIAEGVRKGKKYRNWDRMLVPNIVNTWRDISDL